MVEINPLVVTSGIEIVALDGKLSFDENALFRHPGISELRDKSQEDPRETYAGDRGLNYIGLDGKIGCIVNGAGLAMATLDMIKMAGGEPANFLDVGGGASPERVLMSFKAVLNDKNVEDIKTPLAVRLSGTNGEEGQKLLAESGRNITTASTLAEAANKVVHQWKAADLKEAV